MTLRPPTQNQTSEVSFLDDTPSTHSKPDFFFDETLHQLFSDLVSIERRCIEPQTELAHELVERELASMSPSEWTTPRARERGGADSGTDIPSYHLTWSGPPVSVAPTDTSAMTVGFYRSHAPHAFELTDQSHRDRWWNPTQAGPSYQDFGRHTAPHQLSDIGSYASYGNPSVVPGELPFWFGPTIDHLHLAPEARALIDSLAEGGLDGFDPTQTSGPSEWTASNEGGRSR